VCLLVIALVLAKIPYLLPLLDVADEENPVAESVFHALSVPFAVVGALIAVRRPSNRIGWLLLVGALSISSAQPAWTHAEAWDSAGFPTPHMTAVDDAPFRDEDLAVLQEQFVAGPRTHGWAGNFGGPGLTIHRFQRPGQRVWVATHPEQTEWWLSADSAASLAALTELLASANQANQALARELCKGWRWTGSNWVQSNDPATTPGHSR
jgi:hypothetical protein